MKVFWTLILLGISMGILGASPARVVYTDGPVTVTLKSGKTRSLNIGDNVNTGETIKTGKKGLVELSQDGVTIKVLGQTVFALGERVVDGKTRSVLEVLLGSVQMKYGKLTGTEPLLRTTTVAMGVRGTELELWAGADGGTLLTVTSGLVALESMGKTLEVGAGQGVEVLPGQIPQDTFALRADFKAYETWNQDKIKLLGQDPLGALEKIETRMKAYYDQIRNAKEKSDAHFKDLESLRKQMRDMIAQGSLPEAQAFEVAKVNPQINLTRDVYINYRYNLLGAYALRHYVGQKLYLQQKLRAFENPQAETWRTFLARYTDFIKVFEGQAANLMDDLDFKLNFGQ